jgi:hypothetical protein
LAFATLAFKAAPPTDFLAPLKGVVPLLGVGGFATGARRGVVGGKRCC